MKSRLRGHALAETGQRLFFGQRLRGSVLRGVLYTLKSNTRQNIFLKYEVFQPFWFEFTNTDMRKDARLDARAALAIPNFLFSTVK